jgi:histone acetyltransferase (RNA polymerase elongator complex component)
VKGGGEVKKRHVNIPIFIPHIGCPNACVFCNQRSISGHIDFDPTTVDAEISEALATVGEDAACEIAFFGGSFTGIDRDLMLYLLGVAQKYIDEGRVEGIRMSTRPDYINEQVLEDLSRFTVKTVELGLQSLEDSVLLAAGRGHDAECALRACHAVKAAGYELIGQMMIGLPSATPESEVMTARLICEAGADGARVYPTVVFYDTELACMTARGEYVPLTTEAAVERTKGVLDVFDKAGVPCIRVGLQSSENLADESKVMGGASHSAIGELAMGELYFERICEEIERRGIRGGDLTVYVSRGSVSKAVGQKKKNKERICQKYGIRRIKVLEKSDVLGYNIILDTSI